MQVATVSAPLRANNKNKKCLMQTRKIDPDMIRVLIDEGLSAQEIAGRMGWTVGTLRVRCSQLKISLRRSAIWKSASHIYLTVPTAIFGQLQQHATLMGISESELATDLLKTIVRDDLCKAVLDRDATEVPQWTSVCTENLIRVDEVRESPRLRR
jgi:hypothetical protein